MNPALEKFQDRFGLFAPHLDEERLEFLCQRAEDIDQRVLDLFERITPQDGQKFSKELDWSGLMAAKVMVPVFLGGLLSPLAFWRTSTATLDIVIAAMMVGLGSLVGFMLYRHYSRELSNVRQDYERYVDQQIHSTLWRTGNAGYLPGTNEITCAAFRSFAIKSSPELMKEIFARLLDLRLQYDQDVCAARLEVQSTEKFLIDSWVDPDVREKQDKLRVAISFLDKQKVMELLEDGARLDILMLPYKSKHVSTHLDVARQGILAVKEWRKKHDSTISQAMKSLEGQCREMMAILLEYDPELWTQTKFKNKPLWEWACQGDEDLNTFFHSFVKRQILRGQVGLDKLGKTGNEKAYDRAM